MNKELMTWHKDEVDAISIKMFDCELDIEGTDEDMIKIEVECGERAARNLQWEVQERKLRIREVRNHHVRHTEMKLKLPKSKVWSTDIFSGRANIRVRNVQSCLRIMVGKGNIDIVNLKGKLEAGSGHADIRVKNFTQIPTPELAPDIQESGRHYGYEFQKPERSWLYWGEDEWQDWGNDLGEKISRWAMDLGWWFSHFGGSNINEKDAGLNIQASAGNIEVAEIEAEEVLLKLIKGNLKIQDVSCENLEMKLTRGDIEGEVVVPSGKWTIKSVRGDIQLSIPSNISIRLDMATTSGDINSEIPLVRVTRRGPETYSGRRMVGTIGPAVEGKMPELYITAVRGNIEIDSHSPVYIPVKNNIPEDNREEPAVLSVKPGDIGMNTTGPICFNNQTAVLEALREGKISVDEAYQLLHSLDLLQKS